MKTTSSAKRVTQVRSAGGYKASTVIWEVNFNQIFPEFGPNTSFIEFSNLISQLRILEHAKLFSGVRVSPFTSCAFRNTSCCVCVCGSSCFLSQRCLLALALISSFPAMCFSVCVYVCVKRSQNATPRSRKVTTSRDKTTHTVCLSASATA